MVVDDFHSFNFGNLSCTLKNKRFQRRKNGAELKSNLHLQRGFGDLPLSLTATLCFFLEEWILSAATQAMFSNSILVILILDLQIHCLETRHWSKIDTSISPPARNCHATSLINGKMYLFGGFNGTNLNDFWSFDLSTNIFIYKTNILETKQWTLISESVSEISARNGHILVSFDNLLLLHGGVDDQGPKGDLYSFNTGTTISSKFH